MFTTSVPFNPEVWYNKTAEIGDAEPCEYCDEDATDSLPMGDTQDDFYLVPVCKQHKEKYDR